jgi:hypothetical protein
MSQEKEQHAQEDEARALLAEAIEYTDHQSWRCDHPPHWYLADSSAIPEGDCPCGLRSLNNRIANFLRGGRS